MQALKLKKSQIKKKTKSALQALRNYKSNKVPLYLIIG